MPEFTTRSTPTDTEAPARTLASGAMALTAMSFLVVAFSFDANAARPAAGAYGAASMSVLSRAEPQGHSTVPTRHTAATPTAHVVPVPVPVSMPAAPMAEAGPRSASGHHKGPRVANKPRPRTKAQPKPPTARKAKLRPASADDSALVSDAISRRMTALGRCYERALLRTPGLSGKMSVRVEVAPDGRITSAQVRRSSIRDAWLKGCVEERIAGWRLPHLNDGSPVRVTIPVSFVR